MRLGEFGKLLGRREALDRRCQHGVRNSIAIGRAIKLRKSQRSAQFKAPCLLRLRDRDRGVQKLEPLAAGRLCQSGALFLCGWAV